MRDSASNALSPLYRKIYSLAVRVVSRPGRKTFKGEPFLACVPLPQPPDPPLALQPLLPLLDQANQALGRLDGLASILPDPSLFIYFLTATNLPLSSLR